MPNERKSTVLLEHHLKQLKLPTMLKTDRDRIVIGVISNQRFAAGNC